MNFGKLYSFSLTEVNQHCLPIITGFIERGRDVNNSWRLGLDFCLIQAADNFDEPLDDDDKEYLNTLVDLLSETWGGPSILQGFDQACLQASALYIPTTELSRLKSGLHNCKIGRIVCSSVSSFNAYMEDKDFRRTIEEKHTFKAISAVNDDPPAAADIDKVLSIVHNSFSDCQEIQFIHVLWENQDILDLVKHFLGSQVGVSLCNTGLMYSSNPTGLYLFYEQDLIEISVESVSFNHLSQMEVTSGKKWGFIHDFNKISFCKAKLSEVNPSDEVLELGEAYRRQHSITYPFICFELGTLTFPCFHERNGLDYFSLDQFYGVTVKVDSKFLKIQDIWMKQLLNFPAKRFIKIVFDADDSFDDPLQTLCNVLDIKCSHLTVNFGEAIRKQLAGEMNDSIKGTIVAKIIANEKLVHAKFRFEELFISRDLEYMIYRDTDEEKIEIIRNAFDLEN